MADGEKSNQRFNPGKISITKLTDDNFLLWKFQITTALEGYGLEIFLENDPPPKYQASFEWTSSTIQTMITEYKIWKRQDRLISSWLLGSMSEDILTQLINY